MSPKNRPVEISDLYTAVLALAALSVLFTAIFVAIKCVVDYGTLFKIVELSR